MIDTEGGVCFDGHGITAQPTEAIARAGIAHVPQGRGTFGDLSVEENLRLGAHGRKDRGVDADLARWLEVPGARRRRDQNAGSLAAASSRCSPSPGR